jgi:hypothetical protein
MEIYKEVVTHFIKMGAGQFLCDNTYRSLWPTEVSGPQKVGAGKKREITQEANESTFSCD